MLERMTTDRGEPGTAAEWTPPDIRPGPEMEALSRFLWNGTWTGTVEPGGMGPGSPAMDARGRATCEPALHGLWLDCHFEQDQFVDGRPVLNWQARWIMGWDRDANEYRAVGADTNGRAFIFHGEIDGSRLVMESLGESPVRLRFTWEVVDERTVGWKNELSFGGGPWQLIETYALTPSG
jgi:hypothetical protein